MKCRNSIFKFLGIAVVSMSMAACTIDDAADVPLVKLGAVEKEFVVEADASTFDIDIYTNGAYHIERINEADWLSLSCGETVDGKAKITAECTFNEDFKRKAGFVLCSDVDSRRDTLYVKQKALIDAEISFENSSVIVAGAGGENRSAIKTNVPFEEITVDITYANEQYVDWIESIEIIDAETEDRELVIKTTQNEEEEGSGYQIWYVEQDETGLDYERIEVAETDAEGMTGAFLELLKTPPSDENLKASLPESVKVEGWELDQNQLSNNLGEKGLTVHIEVLESKSVALNFEVSGTPAEGWRLII